MEHERAKLRFTKAEGAQNDFLIVDDRLNALSPVQRSALAVLSCHRRRSVGGDGVIFIVPSEENDFRMEFYNPDGSHGSMCGNGGRTAALWAYMHGITPAEMRFDVLGLTYRAVIYDDGVRLYFPPPREIRIGMILRIGGADIPVHYAHTGAPHAVVLLEDLEGTADLEQLDVPSLGTRIRHHPRFQPVGVNVNFVAFRSGGSIGIRTFEKGVEGETEACGTGNIASAIIAHTLKSIPPPVALTTHGGDVLRVGFDPLSTLRFGDGEQSIDPSIFASGLYLEGPARIAFEGELTLPEQFG